MSLRFCSSHLSDLIGELRHRGMGPLLHCLNQPAEYSERFARRWTEGTAAREEFDPLVIATLEINKKYVSHFGAPINGHGIEQCALCLAQRHSLQLDIPEAWIEQCGQQLAEVASGNGLL